jgi:hypothetical protein
MPSPMPPILAGFEFYSLNESRQLLNSSMGTITFK